MNAPSALRRRGAGLFVLLTVLGLGHMAGTQYIAHSMSYNDAFLGAPLAVDEAMGVKFYAPWMSYIWAETYWRGRPQEDLLIALGMQAGSLALGLMMAAAGMRSMRVREASGAHGTSRFASEEEVTGWGLKKDVGVRLKELVLRNKKRKKVGQAPEPESSTSSVVLGKSAKGEHYYGWGPEHLLCFAPTRSGKGVGLVIPGLLTWTGSCVVVDIKGENYQITGWWRSLFSHVVYFDPTKKSSARYNPLLEMRPERLIGDVKNLAQILMSGQNTSGEESIWTSGARTLLEIAMVHVLMTDDHKNLGRVVDRLASLEQMLDEILECGGYGPEHSDSYHFAKQGALELTQRETPDALEGWKANAQRALDLWRDPFVRQATVSSDFRLRDLQYAERPVSLYVVIPPSDLKKLGPIVRMLFMQLTDVLTEAHDDPAKNTNKHRLLMMMDEFPQLGRMDKIENAIAYTAGYGIKWFFITQGLDQLDKIYGKDNSILSNCHTRVAYRCNDDRNATRLSDLCGKATVFKDQEGESGNKGIIAGLNKRSVSHIEVGRELMTPGEVMQMPDDDELLLIAGKYPIKAKKITYYDDPAFVPKFKGRALEMPSERLHDFPQYVPTAWEDQRAWADLQGSASSAQEKETREAYTSAKMPVEEMLGAAANLTGDEPVEVAQAHMTGQISAEALKAIKKARTDISSPEPVLVQDHGAPDGSVRPNHASLGPHGVEPGGFAIELDEDFDPMEGAQWSVPDDAELEAELGAWKAPSFMMPDFGALGTQAEEPEGQEEPGPPRAPVPEEFATEAMSAEALQRIAQDVRVPKTGGE